MMERTGEGEGSHWTRDDNKSPKDRKWMGARMDKPGWKKVDQNRPQGKRWKILPCSGPRRRC